MKKYIILGAFLVSSISSVSVLSDISHSDFREYIINAQSENIISGYDDGTFKPNNPVSFIESLKMAINTGPQRNNVNSTPGQNWFMPFLDHYNNNQKVDFLHFSNNEYITRDFAIYLVLKQLGIELDSSDAKYIPVHFTDVNEHTQLGSYIYFAKYAGIIQGYTWDMFGPKNRVSRGEFTKMLWKSLREDREQIMQKYSAVKNKTTNNIPKTVHIGIKELGVSFDIPAKRKSHFSYEQSIQNGKIATISYGDFFGAVSQYSPQPRGGYEPDNARRMVRGSSDFEYTIKNYCSFTNTTLGPHDCERFTTQNNIFYTRGVRKYTEMGGTRTLQQMQYFIENKNSEFPVITLWTKEYPTSNTAGMMKEAREIEAIIESMQDTKPKSTQSYVPVRLDTTNWKTYNNSKYNFSFRYPSSATLNIYEGDTNPQGKKVNVAEMLMLNFPKGAIGIFLPGFETFHGGAPIMDKSDPIDVMIDGKKISKSYMFFGQAEPQVGAKEQWELRYYVPSEQLPKEFSSSERGLSLSYYFTPEVAYTDGFEESFRDREIEATIESIIADIIR